MMISRALRLAILFMLASTIAQAGASRPVVVELYTSQGCNSCPPADAYLGKLAARPDVLALSLPVTYWDMLGWKDTLASDANTRRQKAYAAAMGHGGVYTPQIIVDGVQDYVGSRTATVEAAIEARSQAIAAETPGADSIVPVSLSENAQEMHIGIEGGSEGARDATVWLFHLRSAVNVAISAGENVGHTISYHNVVADLRAVGVWKGGNLSLTLPRAAMTGVPHDAVAVIVQQGGYGHVVGAAYLAHPDFYPIH